MPIRFVSASHIRRTRGHSAVQRLAYIGRQRLTAKFTGKTYDYTDRGYLSGPVGNLLPDGAPDRFEDSAVLWNAIEDARANAVLGLELVISLPSPTELDDDTARRLLVAFLNDVVLFEGLGATFAVHDPHPYDPEDVPLDLRAASVAPENEDGDDFASALFGGQLNRHAHVLVTPRRLCAAGLSRTRCTVLDEVVRNGRVVDALQWHRLWSVHQNRFFAEHGLPLRVRPLAPVAVTQAPLKKVRRWRRRQRRNGEVRSGRELLVDAKAEAANHAAFATFEGVFAALRHPFLRADLEMLLRRHLPDRHAEMIDALLGQPEVLQLGVVPEHGSRWYVTEDVVVHELQAFGRASVLAGRASNRPNGALPKGLSPRESAIVNAVATASELVLIDAFDQAHELLETLAAHARWQGRVQISVSHGARSSHPQSRIVKLADLAKTMISGALVLVDEADALDAAALDFIVQACLAGRCQLVLVRRRGGIWPRSEFIERFLPGTRLEWGAAPVLPPLGVLFQQGELAAAIGVLDRNGAIIRAAGRAAATADAIATARKLAGSGSSVFVLAADAERTSALHQELRKVEGAEAGTVLPDGSPATVIALIDATASSGPMLTPQLARARRLVLIIDSNQAPSTEDLLAQLALDRPVGIAIAHAPASWYLRQPLPRITDERRPAFAIDSHGEIVTDPAHIDEAVVFYSSAPLTLDWAGTYSVSAAAVRAALDTLEPISPGQGVEPSGGATAAAMLPGPESGAAQNREGHLANSELGIAQPQTWPTAATESNHEDENTEPNPEHVDRDDPVDSEDDLSPTDLGGDEDRNEDAADFEDDPGPPEPGNSDGEDDDPEDEPH